MLLSSWHAPLISEAFSREFSATDHLPVGLEDLFLSPRPANVSFQAPFVSCFSGSLSIKTSIPQLFFFSISCFFSSAFQGINRNFNFSFYGREIFIFNVVPFSPLLMTFLNFIV